MNGEGLSCLVVSYNTRDDTIALIASVLTQAESAQVVVVDNGSADGSVEALRESFPQITVIAAGSNLGFARAVNVGVEAASGRFVLLLNPDMVALPGSIDAVLRFAEDHPEYSIYGGRTVRRNGDLEPSSCWAAPTLWSLFMFATMLSTVFKGSRLFDPESMGDWRRDTVREVEIVTGCLLLIRKSVFEAVGGMDEDYFLYGEDADFCMRIRRNGGRCVIVPDAVMIHDVGGSSAKTGTKTCMVLAGKVTLLVKSWSRARATLGRLFLLAGVWVRATLERLMKRNGLWTTAWHRRADWRRGYPHARQTLFGLPVDG